jgi:hypothetical protein
MKRIVTLIMITAFLTLNTYGQNFFFIGENSFPVTKTCTLQSNSDTSSSYVNNLNFLFGKSGDVGVIIVSTKTVSTVRISGKLLVYLDDGTVISCLDKGVKDNIDDIASTAYYLTNGDLNKLKKSNINTIRYEVKCAECLSNPLVEGNYSASNKGDTKVDFPAVVAAFFNE